MYHNFIFQKTTPNFNTFYCLLFSLFLVNLTIAQNTLEIPDNSNYQNYELSKDFQFEGNKSKIDSLLGQLYPEDPGSYPPTWQPDTIINTGRIHSIVIPCENVPTINGVPIQPGDFIGGFYIGDDGEYYCAGGMAWNGTGNLIFVLFGDDYYTTEKDGFDYGEWINWKIYLCQTKKTYDFDEITFVPGNLTINKWFYLALSYIASLNCIVEFDVSAVATPNPICNGDNCQLSAVVNYSSGGSQTFSWTSDPPGFSSDLQNPVVSPVVTTTYFLEATEGIYTSEHEVTVEVLENPVASAGNDGTICENSTFQASGTVENSSGINWVSSGDGVFNNPSQLNPVYTPGPQDKANGSVMLTIYAQPIAPCSLAASDNLILTIVSLPYVFAGNDKNVCETSNVYVSANVDNYSSLLWTTNGDGTFNNPTLSSIIYFPGTNDLLSGTVDLSITAMPIAPCSNNVSDDLHVIFQKTPTVTAPADNTICENQSIDLVGNAQNFSNIIWETEGNGTFINVNGVEATYIPGTSDIQNGSVILTIIATAVNPCSVPASDQMTLTITRLPLVNAGNTNFVCEDSNLQLNATVTNFQSVFWETDGDGSFNNVYLLNAVYFPGPIDISSGNFNLILTANPILPCVAQVQDVLPVTVIYTPVANAGYDFIICEDVTYQLSGTGENYVSVLWNTSGDGTFDDDSKLDAIYTPGTNDITIGSVELCLIANPIGPCTSPDSDCMILNIQLLPTANSGDDGTICEDDTYQLAGTAENYVSVLWNTSGDGTFDDASKLDAIYTPGTNDVSIGNVELCLTANPIGPCTSPDSDCLTLTIQLLPTANSGGDGTICEDDTYQLNGSVENADSYTWSTAGDGGFNNASLLNAVYTPGTNDVAEGSVELTLIVQPINPCTSVISDSLLLKIFECIHLSINNGWSGISSYINPASDSVESMFQDIIDDLIILQNTSGIYWPEQNINTLGTWYTHQGYLIKVANTVELTISGSRESNKTLQLTEGWNLIPVLSEYPVDVVELFNETDLIIVKEIAGWDIYWPQFGINTLVVLKPGKAYFVLMNVETTITFPE